MTADLMWLCLMAVAVFGCILSGVPVLLAIAGAPTLVAVLASLSGAFDLVYFQAIPQRLFGIMSNPLLLAVPLFVFMGVLLEKSKQAERMLESLTEALGGRKSSLALSVVLVSALIAASTGIIGATIVMLGTITLPALLRAGVGKQMSSGLICASGTLGQIIPPSIVLILLGDQISNAYFEAQQEAGNFAPDPVTVGDLFAGALLPGLLLVSLYAAYVSVRLRGAGATTGQQVAGASPELKGRLLRNIAPTLGLIVAVLGSILIGVATPTEAASVGVAGAILIAAANQTSVAARIALLCAALTTFLLLLRQAGVFGLEFEGGKIVWSAGTLLSVGLTATAFGLLLSIMAPLMKSGVLFPALRETVTVTGMIFGIVMAASILSLVFRGFNGDEHVAEFLEAVPGGPMGMLVVTMLVIFLLGFILEFVEIIFIVVPIVGPIILQSDISPVWFAVLIALNLQTSFLTPPFGFALFYFRSVAPAEIRTSEIYMSVIPFVLIQLLALATVALFPPLATWLPSVLF
ncbi:TRAP transporter large permease subunit [Roseibium denhamense]|uniref:TRAP transporter, DctM subunit n=1 Tax=Roseibium denhamense TaxID=76305 RepID=A0ABY1NT37_9HYPH|nr:TRAP transporter large permease subunit [Roseibium denhamense]MTI08160.1 TRAP transporter large permease subunit [Roseibium denhamense]SMP16914.1 TRAP transporter, DctM subunit [Roseibium denhamense]